MVVRLLLQFLLLPVLPERSHPSSAATTARVTSVRVCGTTPRRAPSGCITRLRSSTSAANVTSASIGLKFAQTPRFVLSPVLIPPPTPTFHCPLSPQLSTDNPQFLFQNTRYVVHSGARQKNEEWDAAENGAFVLDAKPDPSAAPPDAFASLERSQTQKTRALSAAAQLGALEDLQASRWSDPYAASKALRSSFRKEKKVRVESEGRAEGVRDKYALGDRVRKEDLRTPGVEMRAIEDREWGEARAERERREKVRLGKRRREVEQVGWREEEERTKWELSTSAKRSGKSSSSTAVGRPARPTARGKQPSAALKALAAQLHLTTALKADPFRPGAGVGRTKSSTLDGGVKVIKRSGSG